MTFFEFQDNVLNNSVLVIPANGQWFQDIQVELIKFCAWQKK